MIRFVIQIRTAVALGFLNILHVFFYRISLRLSLHSACKLKANLPQGNFFLRKKLSKIKVASVSKWDSSVLLFGHLPFNVNYSAPKWFNNPLTKKSVKATKELWWKISDFDPKIGDIKLIWELSRMDWLLAFAQRSRNGDLKSLERMNLWLHDWCVYNPPYYGPNWKCGQEASIRLMNLSLAAIIMDQAKEPSSSLRDLVKLHLERISSTIHYALAQDNNHGISEAAALFIGGSWLSNLGEPKGREWEKHGRQLLEKLANRLITKQGSFSQYSLNYHRFMIDVFCIVEIWRLHLALPKFSLPFISRIQAAIIWQQHMTNPFNGHGPNIGANDGARLLQLTDANYRDFRPSTQLASALFLKLNYMGEHLSHSSDDNLNNSNSFFYQYWNAAFYWLNIKLPKSHLPAAGSLIDDDGGFAILRRGFVMVTMHYPRFKFRPSQADLLHLDLWVKGENLLRDAGTYSYNCQDKWLRYFNGTRGHNTVEFDDQDQMIKISRFLFGGWIKTSFFEPLKKDALKTQFAAGYKDRKKNSHNRYIELLNSHLIITDKIFGFKNKAVLRWRLNPGKWKLSQIDSYTICCETFKSSTSKSTRKIKVKSSVKINRCEIIQGWESTHYQQKNQVPVLEIEVKKYGTLISEYFW